MYTAKGGLPVALANGATVVGDEVVARVYWFNPVTVGDTFKLTDIAGKVIVEGICDVAKRSQMFEFAAAPIEVSGVAVAQLSSGTLYIYFC